MCKALNILCQTREINIRLLAKNAGVHRCCVYHWLNGRPAPRLEKSIAHFFDLSVPDLRKRVGLDQDTTKDTTDTTTGGTHDTDAANHRVLKSGRTR